MKEMHDFFKKHLNYQLDNDIKPLSYHVTSSLGELFIKSKDSLPLWEKDLNKYKIKSSLLQNYLKLHVSNINNDDNTDDIEDFNDILAYSLFQAELAPIIWSYFDLFNTARTHINSDEIREVYCLHLLNHIVSTRHLVIKNNEKIEKLKQMNKLNHENEDRFRDRGFTRPKVLILVPFRNSALKIVQTLITLLSGTISEKEYVMNKHRFYQEFGNIDETVTKYPSEDRKDIFEGNVDDCFRIGLALSKKTLKLYTDFYSSDIIICSPLGLKTLGTHKIKILTNTETMEKVNKGIIDEEDISKEKDVADKTLDFLSSIEILIIDQADVFLMQNWSHLINLVKMLNKRPIKAHEADFSRIREWHLNGQGQFYRQNLVFSKICSPQINSLFSNLSKNYEGSCTIKNTPIKGVLDRIKFSLTHEFLPLTPVPKNATDLVDVRFKYFVNNILQKRILENNRKNLKRTLIFIPSYFDFIRIRNYLLEKEIKFLSISEYDDEKHIKKVRRLIKTFETDRSHNFELNKGEATVEGNCKRKRTRYEHVNYLNSLSLDETLIVLNTERSYFFRKPRFQDIYECVFYELPAYPDYYYDIYYDCTFVPTTKNKLNRHNNGLWDNSDKQLTESIVHKCSLNKFTCLYDSKYDWIKLSQILGNEKGQRLIASDLVNRCQYKTSITLNSNNNVNGISNEDHTFITGL